MIIESEKVSDVPPLYSTEHFGSEKLLKTPSRNFTNGFELSDVPTMASMKALATLEIIEEPSTSMLNSSMPPLVLKLAVPEKVRPSRVAVPVASNATWPLANFSSLTEAVMVGQTAQREGILPEPATNPSTTPPDVDNVTLPDTSTPAKLSAAARVTAIPSSSIWRRQDPSSSMKSFSGTVKANVMSMGSRF